MARQLRLLVLALSMGLLAAGCTSPMSPTQPSETSPTTVTSSPEVSANQDVESNILDFNLEFLTADVGTTVKWTNLDKAPHTTTAGIPERSTGLWNSGSLSQGGSFSFTFNEAGSFPYFCAIHPDSMRAVVEVVAEQAATIPPLPATANGVDGSLLAVDDHGDDDAEFVVRATVIGSAEESLQTDIELWALDAAGGEQAVATLHPEDRIRLRVGQEQVEVRVAEKGQLIDNEFQVFARAEAFEVVYTVTNASGLTQEDRVTVDLGVTIQVHSAELPLVVD